MECVECGRVYVRRYRVCPDCGADQDPDGTTRDEDWDDFEPPEWEAED